MTQITAEERFLFDLQGFLLLRNVLEQQEVQTLLDTIERVKQRFIAEPEPEVEGRWTSFETHIPDQIRFNGILRLDPAFDALIAHPKVMPYLREFVDGPNLGNAWMIQKTAGAQSGGWHRGVSPNEYNYRNGTIRTRMLNVVFFLTDNGPDDGCVVAIPGSHKCNFDLNWHEYQGLEMPGSVAVTGKAGDVFMFSEATVHNGLPKTTEGERTNLYFNYTERNFGVLMFDATPINHRHYAMPPSVRERFTQEQKDVTKWMEFVKAEE